MVQIIDASALIHFFQKQYGYEKVKLLFDQASQHDRKILMSSVNWGEVYGFTLKILGQAALQGLLTAMEALPIEIVPADGLLAQEAGHYKADRGLPYADAFAAALTKQHNGQLITSDKDFKAVEGDIHIFWV